MSTRRLSPPLQTRRPAEPLRPVAAARAGATLLAVKARRRRHDKRLPPRAGEMGY